jgi:heme oxygenase
MSTLRELTAESHTKAENTVFMRLLMAKALTPYEYMDYLTQFTLVYDGLEYAANRFGILQEFDGIQRSSKIKADLEEANNVNGKRCIIRLCTTLYYNYLINLDDKEKVAAHFYVRFAGDMFGGQMLKSLVPSTGRMYDFENNLPALRMKMREFATPNLAEEANKAFGYTIDIVDEICGVKRDLWL